MLKRCAISLILLCQVAMARGEEKLPSVPPGFQISTFAKEPWVRNPCAMAFDDRGRLFVSQGQQYRNPRPSTPGDRITILLDTDGNGTVDRSRTFAEGFNHIQGLVWHGKDLWVANAPDLTVVRDHNGDDKADEYILIYGGLGNLEHALHGLNVGPDGLIYMSKGNSKGYVNSKSPELRVAPKAFTDLWGIPLPPGAPVIPEPLRFKPEDYKRGYHHPSDDWGREGGILRCDSQGKHLEIVSRGMRNSWDMAFDENFEWLATDQDQDGGDRILQPFYGSHFGWGHGWSPHWSGKDHIPTVPISGPLFHGSGTGVVYSTSEELPLKYRGIYFVNDWLRRRTMVFRPRWQGALMVNMTEPEVFIDAGSGRSLGASSGLLFDPTDIEVGPDGAVWILSWGHGYGAKINKGKQVDAGRVYRVSHGKPRQTKLTAKYLKKRSQWTVAELIEDLRHDRLPVWRVNAQQELLRRGKTVEHDLIRALETKQKAPGAFTWILWTLGRLNRTDEGIQSLLTGLALRGEVTQRIQAVRVLGHRAKWHSMPLPREVVGLLKDREPRLRAEVARAIHGSRRKERLEALWSQAGKETDRMAFYSIWRALGELSTGEQLREKLASKSNGIRLAALLGLLEGGAISGDEAAKLRLDRDRRVAEIASSFVEKVGTEAEPVIRIEPLEPVFSGEIEVRLSTQVKGAHIRYTLDGTAPTDTSGRRYSRPLRIKKSTVVHAVLFHGRAPIGPVVRRDFRRSQYGSKTVTWAVPPIAIEDIKVASGSDYRVTALKEGGRVYTDRRYQWQAIPEQYQGAAVIQTSNEDSEVGSRGDAFLRFRLTEEAIVVVAHDQRIRQKPKWLGAFERLNPALTSEDATFDLYQKKFSEGMVVLGGNTIDGEPGGRSQYAVIVAPAPPVAREKPSTLKEVLSRMKTANGLRGERLFFRTASCASCHRLGERGYAYAPDLSNLGERAEPKIIAESILTPDAVITEGFHSLLVHTTRGKIYKGFIQQESGLNLDLIQDNGIKVTIPRKLIEERQRIQGSAMPSGYASLLSPQQIADLIHFIGQHKKAKQE